MPLNFQDVSFARDFRYDAGLSFQSSGAELVSYGSFDELMSQKLYEARREPVSPDKSAEPPSEESSRVDENKDIELSNKKPDNAAKDKSIIIEEKRSNEMKVKAALEKKPEDKDAEGKLAFDFAESAELLFGGAIKIASAETAAIDGADNAEDAAVDGGLSLSPEDGIHFTDTLPLHENKPDAIYSGLELFINEDGDGAETSIEIAALSKEEGAKPNDESAEADIHTKTGVPAGEWGEIDEAGAEAVLVKAGTAKTETAVNLKDGGSKEESVKKKGDTKKFSIEVTDLRTAGTVSTAETQAKPAETPLRAEALQVKDINVELRAGGALPSESRPVSMEQFRNADAKSSEQLGSFLTRELHNNLNGDIVRHASVMLRDGGEGLIRLRLHPESLGNVHVRLSLSGNKVEGVITVESAEAFAAFESEKAALETAFRESGFDGASLNMQFSGSQQNDNRDGERAGAFSRVLAASGYESHTTTAGLSERIDNYIKEGISILA